MEIKRGRQQHPVAEIGADFGCESTLQQAEAAEEKTAMRGDQLTGALVVQAQPDPLFMSFDIAGLHEVAVG